MTDIKELAEVKKIELDILKCFHDYCEKNSLRYFLAYGTLLGAVRHGGFIPWDDDIDVVMPRADYEKFIREFKNDCYEVYDLSKKGYFYPFAKLCDSRTVLIENIVVKNRMGIYIDIFPMDGVGEDVGKQISKIKRNLKLQQHKYSPFSRKRSLIKKILLPIVKLLLLPLSCQRLGQRMNDEAKKNSYDDCNLVGCLCEDVGKSLFFEREVIEPISSISFEGYSFCAPADVDKYLTCVYGDYMKLPPIDQQMPKHSFKAYWI